MESRPEWMSQNDWEDHQREQESDRQEVLGRIADAMERIAVALELKADTDFARLVARFNELAEIDSKSPISIEDPGWSEWYMACGTWVAKKARGG